MSPWHTIIKLAWESRWETSNTKLTEAWKLTATLDDEMQVELIGPLLSYCS